MAAPVPPSRTPPVCIVAGEGALPVQLAAALSAEGRGVLLAEMAGHTADNPGGHEVVQFRVERLGALFRALRARGVAEVVMAGTVHRPRFDPLAFDLKTLGLLPRVLRALRQGDDGLLRAVVALFEAEGFRIRGAHEFLTDLVASPGALTAARPDARLEADAARAREILATLGPADVAQACAVAGGLCLGIESIYGTDALLGYVAQNRPRRRPDTGGVLMKTAKPGQDLRVDMPVIGPETVAGAAAARLGGICIEAGRVMILDAGETVRRAEAAGVVLWAR